MRLIGEQQVEDIAHPQSRMDPDAHRKADSFVLFHPLSDTENVHRMVAGEIDGFLADPLSGYASMTAAANRAIATPLPIAVFDSDVHVMFSRATVLGWAS